VTIEEAPLGYPGEAIGGVPLGYSRDYDRLPLAEPLRDVRCRECSATYADALRQLEDGCRILAMLCPSCREDAREEWIAAQHVELPQAVAQYRRRTA
jgi:hypothetical protein